MRPYRPKNLISLFPLFMIGAVTGSVHAYNDSKINIPLSNAAELPSEAFLDFLASGINVALDEEPANYPVVDKNTFIDPMEIQQLDNIGLLATLKQASTSVPPIQSNNLIKENKE